MSKFWALANPSDQTLTNKAKAYKEWCDKSLDSKPTKNLVKNVEKFCNDKGYTNFKQKLEKDKEYTALSEKEMEGKYEKLNLKDFRTNNPIKTLVAIGGGEDKWQEALLTKDGVKKLDEKKFKEKYKEYCKKQGDLDFSEDGRDNSYAEYRWLCGKKR